MATLEQVISAANLITPEVWNAYTENLAPITNKIIASGITVTDPRVSAMINSGSKSVNMPFFNDLYGTAQVLGDGDVALVPDNMNAGSALSTVSYRGKAWGLNDMAAVFVGAQNDVAGSLMSKMGEWWNRADQRTLLSILNGLFAIGGALNGVHTFKYTSDGTAAGAPKAIDMSAVLYAKQLLGDYADHLKTLIMYSAVFTALQAQQQIITVPAAQTEINFPTYLGYNVIVDDSVGVNSDGTYNTYLVGDGAFGRNLGTPSHLTTYETFREAKYGTTNIFTRRALVLHPYGMTWTNASLTGDTAVGGSGLTASDVDYANPANWKLVNDPKKIALVQINHAVPSGMPKVVTTVDYINNTNPYANPDVSQTALSGVASAASSTASSAASSSAAPVA